MSPDTSASCSDGGMKDKTFTAPCCKATLLTSRHTYLCTDHLVSSSRSVPVLILHNRILGPFADLSGQAY